MAKRLRSLPALDQLTGGSQDVNPQYFVCSLQIPGSSVQDLVISNTVTIPVPPVGLGNNNLVQVPEILDISSSIYGAADISINFTNGTTKWAIARITQGSAYDNAGTQSVPFPPSNRTMREFFIQGGNAVASISSVTQASGVGDQGGTLSANNMTDEAGHGIILYGNTLTLSAQCRGTPWPAATCIFNYWVKYRIKNVSLADYVQGQAALLGAQN